MVNNIVYLQKHGRPNDTGNFTFSNNYQSIKNNELYSIENVFDIKFRIMFAVKTKNSGKINSHWWFFNIFGQYLKPEFCIQMDTGTAPRYDAVFHCINKMTVNLMPVPLHLRYL